MAARSGVDTTYFGAFRSPERGGGVGRPVTLFWAHDLVKLTG